MTAMLHEPDPVIIRPTSDRVLYSGGALTIILTLGMVLMLWHL